MHAEQARLVVVIEMSGPDSLSDAVSRQVHFERTHPEYQLTKAMSACRERGGGGTKTAVVHTRKCCLCLCVARVTCLYL